MNPSNQFLHFRGFWRIRAPTGGVPETPKHPPRNPAGASPGPSGPTTGSGVRSFYIMNRKGREGRGGEVGKTREVGCSELFTPFAVHQFSYKPRRTRVRSGSFSAVPGHSRPAWPDLQVGDYEAREGREGV